MSKNINIKQSGGLSVCGLIWAMLIITKLLGMSHMGWPFTIFFPLIWIGCFLLFIGGCAAIGGLIYWLSKRS